MSLNIATLVVQCEQMDSHGLLFSYVDFDVWADGQVECMKDLLVKKKRGKT